MAKRWEEETRTANWTRRLIRSVERWTECQHRRTGYYFTQFFTGHGSFGTYTLRIGKTDSDECEMCKVADSPEHMYSDCSRWKRDRNSFKEKLGELPDLDDVVDEMLENKEIWEVTYEFITVITRKKEIEDRKKQQETR
ncbi:uncharacterized protein LOC123682445 [Harmonia axyridis]|uniref:uncharacterized protein LOC123682445 n=1 Tax=Harmonia axyridis TaxID=115357 RepID=UPI001E27526F|nr:uncharacterized protein LOC123682445 [Harmonia axyridis]